MYSRLLGDLLRCLFLFPFYGGRNRSIEVLGNLSEVTEQDSGGCILCYDNHWDFSVGEEEPIRHSGPH